MAAPGRARSVDPSAPRRAQGQPAGPTLARLPARNFIERPGRAHSLFACARSGLGVDVSGSRSRNGVVRIPTSESG